MPKVLVDAMPTDCCGYSVILPVGRLDGSSTLHADPAYVCINTQLILGGNAIFLPNTGKITADQSAL
jgi:hypothetical protein